MTDTNARLKGPAMSTWTSSPEYTPRGLVPAFGCFVAFASVQVEHPSADRITSGTLRPAWAAASSSFLPRMLPSAA
ncbi:hypothetical protein JCM24511_08168 [Saitozyma sp. JCM 24511]|nr:hypothetical protein JCM24511_08168 [Saitozyma sp. JCM 24511]